MEAEEQRQMFQHDGEGENEASLSLPCGRQKMEFFEGLFPTLHSKERKCMNKDCTVIQPAPKTKSMIPLI